MSQKRKRQAEEEPRMVVSYGVLLYKRDDNDDGKIRYLLGLIPQGNWWTVFKGMPQEEGETPTQTALREFCEETGTTDVLESLSPITTLTGRTSNKRLEIYLQEGGHVSTDCFQLERVVKIDQGYMKGQPEIIKIQWMTLEEALEGVGVVSAKDKKEKLVKIYPSQVSILRDAQAFLLKQQE